jgi:hypothetical protein
MLRRVRVPIQQGFGGYDKAGRANAALKGGVFQKLLLKGMEPSGRGDALDGDDGPPLGLDCQDQAGVDQHAVQDDVASAAIAAAAPFFGACQPQLFSQHFQQALPRLTQKLNVLTVDVGVYEYFLGHGLLLNNVKRET